MHEIRIRQAEVARIEQEQEQLRLEQEHVQREQEANAALLASQAQQAPVAFGSHTLCYDEHGQELDYHDDVPTADSQEWKGWGKFLHQQGDSCGLRITDRLDAEHELLHGPTMPSTVSEEAVLLEEMPTAELVGETPTVKLVEQTPNAELEEVPTAELEEEPTPTAELLEMPAAEEATPTLDMRVLSRTENPHAQNVERSLYTHRTLTPAGILQIGAYEITSTPSGPTRHTDRT